MTKELINKGDSYGRTPLHLACIGGDGLRKVDYTSNAIDTIKILINDNRTNVNAVVKYGQTALMLAARSQPKVAIILIENEKCDVNIKDIDGKTVLDIIKLNISKIDEKTKQEMIGKLLQRKKG